MPHPNRNFWVNANGNFLDIAVLEFCKLFAESGKHDWSKVVQNDPDFLDNMHAEVGKSNAEWLAYLDEMRKYRDKFVAHWDDLDEIPIPDLEMAKDSAAYLLEHLVAHEGVPEQWHDAPQPLVDFYDDCLAHGRASCKAIYT
jgi:hypothetical protein